MATNTEIFNFLLDRVYPQLNDLHGLHASRRFWAILLYRYLRNCMIVHAASDRSNLHELRLTDDSAVLGPRVGQSVAATPSGRRLTGFRIFTGWLQKSSGRVGRPWNSAMQEGPFAGLDSASHSVLGDFHYYEPISSLVDQPTTYLTNREYFGAGNIQTEKRTILREMSEGINEPLARLALDWLPKCYVEEFESRICPSVPYAERMEFHASHFFSLGKRFVIAQYVEAGARLFIYQHAAMYGELEDHVFHHAETTIADRFLTWGWKLREKDVPFIALRLIKPERDRVRNIPGADTWLYVNVRQPFAWNMSDTLAIQRRFIQALRPAQRKCIMIRPRVNKGGSPRQQVDNAVVEQIKGIDSGKTSMAKLLGSAEVVVLDMFPSTAFMECLTAGKPVIAIVPGSTAFTEQAWTFYEDFFRLGLLHHSPEDAAEFLNEVSISCWWAEIMGSDLVRAYMDAFCRTHRG